MINNARVISTKIKKRGGGGGCEVKFYYIHKASISKEYAHMIWKIRQFIMSFTNCEINFLNNPSCLIIRNECFNCVKNVSELAKNPVPGIPPHQPLPAHMMPPFTSILYPYQLAMAQAAGGKGLVELQRQAADLQRQYLLDMIPSQASQAQGNQAPPRAHPHNWKT